MKKFKILVVAAILFATASAFATKQSLTCSGTKYFYEGTLTDPSQDTEEDNFTPVNGEFGEGYTCITDETVCTWYRVSEGVFAPCELDPPGIYTETSPAK